VIYDIFDSPIGKLTVASNGKVITALHIEGDRYFTSIPSDWTRSQTDPLLMKAGQQLEEYFAGTRQVFELPLASQGTEFQMAVWNEIARVAFGSSCSYADIAVKLGKPKAVRAVGTAVGRNPICLIVPCHRVLTSTGDYGGYVAGLSKKRHLLSLEGVR
jgi:methylated-DNA-[protein]-cysteine S-methyltransferase